MLHIRPTLISGRMTPETWLLLSPFTPIFFQLYHFYSVYHLFVSHCKEKYMLFFPGGE